MAIKHLHFTETELAARRFAACQEMKGLGIDALVCFRQESLYYLTGYDTFGYVYFQCLLLTSDGRTALLVRAPDFRQAHFTSTVEDVRVWVDREGANPAEDLQAMLADYGLFGRAIGIEYEAYGLTPGNARRIDFEMQGFCQVQDASDIITRLRLVKSAAEIGYVRRAAELADKAWGKALELARPGAFEGDILAAMHGEIFQGGGDDPANEFIIGSGSGALMCRYFTGRRHLSADDHLTLEFAGTYRHYHSCLFRTVRIGKADPHQMSLYKASQDALAACEAEMKPGRTVGDIFEAHARVLDEAGLSRHRMHACGYSLGATFAPNWMDWPMIYRGNPVVLAPGMVFFLHMIVFDSDAGVPATVGRTSLITDAGAFPLSTADLALPVIA